ncbi:flagellar motor protein MotB [Gallaecimonas xiamenensis]|uniref:OmpA family protein n=1 Tax=Gallaecimonas xiamenensis 3-C-1 TaxID=745411 RepID=K2JLU5_9GAMM|nr:flagellar motor protein MotB [Gallaecimonas xiamenensis]EKE75397.1 ompA family protein [Gallaecimonas xiamenensis 3-C-1]
MYRYRRQHKVRHKDNGDRWLVSYADYMTLMFALFVVLYAFVLLEKDEFQDVVAKLEDAVQGVAKPRQQESHSKDGQSEQVAGHSILPDGAGLLDGGALLNAEGNAKQAADEGLLADQPDTQKGMPLPELAEKLAQALKSDNNLTGARMHLGEDWLTLELPDDLLFSRASATLQKPARDLLSSLAPALKSANNYIRVRGYTDSTPIEDPLFPSNWELSAARAAAVLRELVGQGVEAPRLALEGYGAFGQDQGLSEADKRRVVLALSVYGWKKPKPLPTKPLEEAPQLREVSLPGGGIRITTRQDN